MQAAMHVLRYLKGSPNKGPFNPATNNFHVTAFCDADWGTCPMSARFLTGYCIFLGSSLVSWKSKKQKMMYKSSAEVEYRSMSYTTSELEWISHLLTVLHASLQLPISMYSDNTAA